MRITILLLTNPLAADIEPHAAGAVKIQIREKTDSEDTNLASGPLGVGGWLG